MKIEIKIRGPVKEEVEARAKEIKKQCPWIDTEAQSLSITVAGGISYYEITMNEASQMKTQSRDK